MNLNRTSKSPERNPDHACVPQIENQKSKIFACLLTLTSLAYVVAGVALIAGSTLFFRADYERVR